MSGYDKRRAWTSRLFVVAMLVLCAVLGVLQYGWIGEVSRADSERLRATLQANLGRLARDFNGEITAACAALLTPPSGDERDAEREYAARYSNWKRATSHGRIFKRIALALPSGDGIVLRELDLDAGTFRPMEWPADWSAPRERLEARLSHEPGAGRRPPMPIDEVGPPVFDLPRFAPRGREPDDDRPGPFRLREVDWLVVELNQDYLLNTLLPELMQRHLATGGRVDYRFEVTPRRDPARVLHRSDPDNKTPLSASADGSVGLLEFRFDQIFRPFGGRDPGPGGPGSEGPPRRGFNPDMGRWRLFVQHRAGSLDAVVAAARRRNLAVTSAVLLLMMAAAAALLRYTRNAQKLAEMQMSFVAGVSHELRTPLTVIHTAAYNLRGGVARNPSQVERYGALIHQEGERLEKLVEQVLRFANANAGRVLREPRPVSLESVIEDALESTRPEITEADCSVETHVDEGLPLVMGDETALRHALQNLFSNAAKYGAEGAKWIGVYASATGGPAGAAVEIRVADRGPGIPADEQDRVFDPFYRGRQAVRDQVSGAGLGLNLVKKIVEAHGGAVRVRSEAMQGTEFIVRLPAAPPEQQDEFTNFARRG